MFRLATFAAGSVFIGLLITIISTLVLFVIVQMIKGNGKHSPISYMVGAIVASLLLITNVTFCGLVSSKNALTDMEMSPEYRMAQHGSEMLSNISPVLSEIASFVMEDSIMSPEMLEYQRQKINGYLWLLAIISIVIFCVGGGVMVATMGNAARGYGNRYSGRRDVSKSIQREHRYAHSNHRR